MASSHRPAAVALLLVTAACAHAPPPGPGAEFAPPTEQKVLRRPARLVGGTKAGLCVNGHLSPEGAALASKLQGPVTVIFSVEPDGEIANYRMLTNGVPAALTDAIAAALRACPWEPAIDLEGRATSSVLVLPMRFDRGDQSSALTIWQSP